MLFATPARGRDFPHATARAARHDAAVPTPTLDDTMRGRKTTHVLVAAALAWCGLAQAQVDLSVLDAEMAGPRAQVLVLGSVHLSQLPEDAEFDRASLQPLLRKLVAYAPDVITIEALSGETCDLMRRHPAAYLAADVDHYCPDTALAKAATGLDVPAAIAEVQRILETWPQAPTPAQRRHLASRFLAVGDPASALVQWWQLPDAERRAGDGLDDALVQDLRARETRDNESYQVAARLAARLGLARVHPTDDHTADNVDLGGSPEEYGKAIMALWDRAAPRAKPMRDREDALAREGEMLALYRFINAPENLQLRVESDFAAALRDTSSQHFGQRYVAGWEGRNLRMVSNIRAAFADRPGARVLSVVGATHKPWFDSLLGQMQGVDIVDVEQVLE